MTQTQFNGIYAQMKFEPYKFREYPKWVKAGGKDVMVNTQEEERELLAVDPTAQTFDPVVVEKRRLGDLLVQEQKKQATLQLELERLQAQIKAMQSQEKVVAVDLPQPEPEKKPEELNKRSVEEVAKAMVQAAVNAPPLEPEKPGPLAVKFKNA